MLYLLCKALKQDATVAISGESADEVFGGYHWFNLQVARSMNTLPWVPAISFYHLLSPEVQAKIQPEAYLARRYQEALAEIPRLPDEHVDGESIEAKMRELFYLSQTRFLSIMLDRKDRMSMAAGLEVRVPYCDYRIVEYMWNVPWKMKALNQIEKGLLRHAFVDLLPNDARMRRKSVFPVSRNPSYLRAIQQIVQDILNAPNSPVIPLIDRKKARDLAEGEALPEQLSWTTYYLDSLIQINAWLSEYQVRLCL